MRSSLLTLAVAIQAGIGGAAAQGTLERELEGGGREVFEVRPGPAGEVVRHGDYRRMRPDGTLECDGTFEDGLESGRWRFYWPGGEEVFAAGPVEEGRPRGSWRFLYADSDHGKSGVLATGRFENGLRAGKWRFYRRDGSIEELRSGDVEPVLERWPGGALRTVGTRVDGRADGRWTLWWPNGRQALRAHYAGGQPVGEWRLWHPDGFDDPLLQRRDWDSNHDQFVTDWIEGQRDVEREHGAAVPEVAGSFADVVAAVETLVESIPRGAIPGAWPVDASASTARPLDEERGRALGALASDHQIFTDLDPAGRQALGVLVLRELVLHAAAAEPPLPDVLAMLAVQTLGRPARLGLFHVDGQDVDRAGLERGLARLAAVLLLADDRAGFWLVDVERSAFLDPAPGAVAWVRPAFAAPAAEPARVQPRRRSDKEVDRAVGAAAAWLLAHQSEDGHWDADAFPTACDREPPYADGEGSSLNDVGVTGLALVALADAGFVVDSTPTGRAVLRGLRWLLQQQGWDTGLIGETNLSHHVYGHAAATAALARFAPTADSQALQEGLELAVGFLHGVRQPYSGWWYQVDGLEQRVTTPITGWVALALLEAYRVAGIEADPQALFATLSLLNERTDHSTGRLGYLEMGGGSSRLAHLFNVYRPEYGEALTALGITVRLAIEASGLAGPTDEEGHLRSRQLVERGVDLLLDRLPEWTADGSLNDLFYWRFGSSAVSAVRENRPKAHRKWVEALDRALLPAQRTGPPCFEGSWDPNGPWAVEGGRVYATAMALSALVDAHR